MTDYEKLKEPASVRRRRWREEIESRPLWKKILVWAFLAVYYPLEWGRTVPPKSSTIPTNRTPTETAAA